jgi:hypothetical protein
VKDATIPSFNDILNRTKMGIIFFNVKRIYNLIILILIYFSEFIDLKTYM